MRHFLFEDKEYRINPQFRRRRASGQDPDRELLRLLRTKWRSGKKRKSGGTGFFGAVRGGVDARQKCVVKMQYSDSGEAHIVQLDDYLVREGTDIDGGQAKLYGTDIDEYRKNMVDRNFRIFLSPQSKGINLTDLAKRFMTKLENSTGYKLLRQAANHYNTAHPHAHLLINGMDKTGKQVDIPKDIVKTFMREYARDICTSQLGHRTKREIEIEKEKELTATRHTGIDNRIKELCGGTSRINLAHVSGREQQRLLTRLEHLKRMNLCAYKDGGYKMSSGWEEDLRANGRYNTFLAARSALRYSGPETMSLFSGKQGQIAGKVTKVYRADGDTSDNHVVILEGLDGKAYFVPLFRKPEVKDGQRKWELREGEMITVKTYESQKGRLTPFMFRLDHERARKEIRKNNYAGNLALEVLGVSAGRTQNNTGAA
ncbi:MAG: DUF3363 domain-containing protein [Treponema sp.]|nr:DUF3363 domain-containing protein [Treponema sp.]